MKVEGKGPWKERQDDDKGRAVVLSLRVNDKIITALDDRAATITFKGATKVLSFLFFLYFFHWIF